VGDANTFTKLNESFVKKLIYVVCADDYDGFVESYLQLFNEFDDNLWSHVLGSQKLHPCKPTVVPFYTTKIHVKDVKNFHDGVDSFGFVGMLLAFAQLTSRTAMILFEL
jgi:hypothetical protein